MNKIAKLIRKRRQSLGLSGRQLAGMVKIDHSYLSRIESGEQRPDRISWGVLANIAKSLRISLADLTGDMGFKALEAHGRPMTKEEKKILDAIMDRPYNDPKRIAALQLLGVEDLIPAPRPVGVGGRPRKKKIKA